MSEATMRYGTRPRVSRRTHALREGVTVGLIGAAIVMLWFFVVDLAAGVPLRTPALLGAALIDGTRYSEAVTPTARLVVGYTALHLAGFVALGLGVAGLFALAEREKRVLALIFILGCCLAVVFLAAVYLLSLWLGQAVTPAIFLAGHVLAFVSMVGVLAYFHGRLMRRMPEALDGD